MEQAAAHAAPPVSRAGGSVARFGNFEAVPAIGELRKNGIRVRLSGQPFRILLLLLENPGQVVTREALRRQLWPDDTHVDFDHCLNTAINKLRETLGDSAEKPRFIQTIPRLGYRFLAPVDWIGACPQTPEVRATGATAPARRWPAALLIGVPAAVLAGVLAWFLWRSSLSVSAPPRLFPLTSYGGMETTPSFSPDGTEVVFSWDGQAGENFDIYVLPPGRGKLRRLTGNPADEFGPAYSPDGRSIAFYRRSGDYAAVYLVSPFGERMERLFGLSFGPPGRKSRDDPAWSPERVNWSPDGKALAVVDRDTPDGPLRIILRDLEAAGSRALTFPPAGSYGDGYPTFSPDGQYLAFVRRTAHHASDVFLAPVRGGSPKRLVEGGGRIHGLTWTPDGRNVIFSSDRSGNAILWTVPVSGGEAEPVAATGEGALFPSVSPAGHLVYARLSDVGFVMKADLTDPVGQPAAPVRVIPFPASTPQLSPDGRRMTFSSAQSGTPQIWVSEADGTQMKRLTSMPAPSGSPRWSPDGAWIAFDSLERGGWDVFVIRSDGTELRKVTAHEGSDLRPSWASDGKWIYSGSDRSGSMQIWRTPAFGGPAVQITFQGGYDALESPDGEWIFYTRRGVSGLWTRRVDGGAMNDERLLLKELEWQNSRNWSVGKDGIYFLACGDARPPGHECSLKRYRFDTGLVETVRRLQDVRLNNSGCSISRDGRSLVYVQRSETETDLVMVEGWR